MLVSLQHKLAFLAVPKTGTTAIEQALRPYADIILRGNPQVKHMNAETFEKIIRPYLGRVDKRDSQGAWIVIQAGIHDGDQLGTRPDVGRGMGVS